MSSREDSHDRKQGSSIRRKPSTPSSSSRKGSSSERSQRPVAAATRSNSDINRGEKIKRLAAAGKISLNIEEQKAGKRSAESDSRLFSERCEEIRRCLLLIKNMDRSGDGKKFNEMKTMMVLKMLDLKVLNRYDKLRTKIARSSVLGAKQTVDNFYLQLQNLLYEIMYVQKEISRCLEYKSRADGITLLPLEEFYNEAPEGISQPSVTRGNRHLQTLARLEWELLQRQELAKKLEAEDLLKNNCLDVIQKTQDILEKMRPMLMTVLEAIQPICSELEIPVTIDA